MVASTFDKTKSNWHLTLDALRQAGIDKTVTIVAITGDGPFYSSGNDFSAFLSSEDPVERLAKAKPILRQIIRAFYTFPKLLICVVNGPCIGIAATTAALGDVIYATDTVNQMFIFLDIRQQQ